MRNHLCSWIFLYPNLGCHMPPFFNLFRGSKKWSWPSMFIVQNDLMLLICLQINLNLLLWLPFNAFNVSDIPYFTLHLRFMKFLATFNLHYFKLRPSIYVFFYFISTMAYLVDAISIPANSKDAIPTLFDRIIFPHISYNQNFDMALTTGSIRDAILPAKWQRTRRLVIESIDNILLFYFMKENIIWRNGYLFRS